MKIINVVGARPNFMKIAPLIREMKKYSHLQSVLVHTGQHYDQGMSKVFFSELNLPQPDIYLGVGSGSHGEQTGKIMIEFEKVCIREKPDLVLVVGDVNSTLACSVVSAKLGILVAHVEAGLRSFDRAMPEEVNRIVTDSLSKFLFTTCVDADGNLKREGIPEEKIFFVGNVMIDTLLGLRDKAQQASQRKAERGKYALLTLHRPSNVDNQEVFGNILQALQEVTKKIPIIFPAHPRTQKQINVFGYEKCFNILDAHSIHAGNLNKAINLSSPFSYLTFLDYMSNAEFVLTDSGGIQEETTILGIPCLTLRKNTERPITVREGTNILVDSNPAEIIKESFKILRGEKKTGKAPQLWDGKAAERIVKILSKGVQGDTLYKSLSSKQLQSNCSERGKMSQEDINL